MKELIKYLIRKIPTRSIRVLKNRFHKSMEWQICLYMFFFISAQLTIYSLIK